MAERRQEQASEAWNFFSSALKNHLDAPPVSTEPTATPEPIDTESAANTTATGDDDDDEVKSKPSSQQDSHPAPGSLGDKINSFRQRFTAIRGATLQCLERSFQSSIASIMFVIATIIGIKVLQSEVENAFEKYENNIPKLFKFLDHYWNFYSYDILDKFIKKLAAKERLFEPVRKDMEAYKEDMGKFREETTIEQMLLEKELLAIEKTPPDAVEIFIEYDSIRTDSIKTLEDLREFRTAFSGFYMINECAILLKAIGQEFVVAWYIIPTDKKEDFLLEFGDSNIPKEALLFCASEIQQFVDFNVLRQQLQKHGIPESAVAMPATEEGSRPSFEDTCQMLQRVGGIEGRSGAIYHSLRETEGSVGDHKFIADKLEHRAQGMLHRVITLPKGCGPLNIFHLRMSDINEPRAGPTESESGGVFDSEPSAPSYILPPSTFLAMGEEMLAQSSKPQIPEPILKQKIFVVPRRPLSSDPEVTFVECSLYSEFSLAYTGIETEVCWKKAGIGLFLPKAELGREINFTVRVISEDYVLPAEHKNMVLVSAMYHITASETLPEPVRVRMQHCTEVVNENELQFMVAHGEPPFHFTPLPGGVFPPGKCYGEIELDKFSLFSIFWKILGYSSSIDCAVHVGYCDDSSADFIVTKHISTHIEAVETKYEDAKLVPYDLTCSYSSTGISLTVPDTPTNGWIVEPEFEPAKIDMKKIVNYVPGRVIPHIKLSMMWSGHGRPKKEKINIAVEGAEDLDSFKLTCEPLFPCSPQATYITPSQPQTTTPQSQLADTLYPSELEPRPHAFDTPTLPLLRRFPTKSGHFIDIIERIGEKGHFLCIILLNDNCGSLVNTLEEKYRCDPHRVAEAVFVKWLEKEPRTWTDLVKALNIIQLGTLANEIDKNLVCTRPHSSNQVMFTGVVDREGEETVRSLGGEMVDSVHECTHLITDKVRRTVKFLCCLARGCHIVNNQWLDHCREEGRFLPPDSYLVKDRNAERQHKFSLAKSVELASCSKFLSGQKVFLSPSVKPPPSEMSDIITCSGGEVLTTLPNPPGVGVIIVASPDDLSMLSTAVEAGMTIHSTELILGGVLRQELDLTTHQLPVGGASASGPAPSLSTTAGGGGRRKRKTTATEDSDAANSRPSAKRRRK